MSDPQQARIDSAWLTAVRMGSGFALHAAVDRPHDLATVLSAMTSVLRHECVIDRPTTRSLALLAHAALTDRANPDLEMALHACRALAIMPESDA